MTLEYAERMMYAFNGYSMKWLWDYYMNDNEKALGYYNKALDCLAYWSMEVDRLQHCQP